MKKAKKADESDLSRINFLLNFKITKHDRDNFN